jgi:hypothetical protein
MSEPSRPPEDDASHTFSMVLAERWPIGAWLRRNFSLPAVLTIAGLLAAGGGYIINLKTRVIVLETKVVPVLTNTGNMNVLQTRVDDHEQRITRLEGNWDYARDAAALPPRPRVSKPK